ncbi:hypothetical protein [Thalassomonas haliotis]|uniref:Uncharacterized protein n=1 Tax=Thalassomonas haliotis TaxID=485448 RepID=A0ABY7VGR1_9GAMM|nr:hypothetical protein [Thalassomonas haliotis]WDE12887.1 hypothetical protein H3N35_05330 [Thalassomonas haliotis]
MIIPDHGFIALAEQGTAKIGSEGKFIIILPQLKSRKKQDNELDAKLWQDVI